MQRFPLAINAERQDAGTIPVELLVLCVVVAAEMMSSAESIKLPVCISHWSSTKRNVDEESPVYCADKAAEIERERCGAMRPMSM
jgi:secreted trypsin-like serine protease